MSDSITNHSCPRCGHAFASSMTRCPSCGLSDRIPSQPKPGPSDADLRAEELRRAHRRRQRQQLIPIVAPFVLVAIGVLIEIARAMLSG